MAKKALVEDYYDAYAEAEEARLNEARLEYDVTKRILSTCLVSISTENASIVDIGGGPGRYATHLAQQAYKVTLNDLSSNTLIIAKANAQAADVALEDVVHANALDITLHAAPASFDIVLCLGPLSHLIKLEERESVVKNALALAKPGAYILLAYVTVFGYLRDVVRRDSGRFVSELGFYESYLRTGVYDRRSDNESFHVYPENVKRELECVKNGAKIVGMVSCEGFLGFDSARALLIVGEEETERWVDVVM